MHPLIRSIAVALITFAAAIAGMLIQGLVPADVLTASKGSVGAMVGLVGLLLALVLGFLVFTAFSVFATQQSEAYSLAPVIAEIDLALEQYGPNGAEGRAGLRAALQRSRVRFFGDAERGPQPFTFDEMRATFAGLSGYFDSLAPAICGLPRHQGRRPGQGDWSLCREADRTAAGAREFALCLPV